MSNGNGFDHELIMKHHEYDRTGRQIRIPEDELVSIVLERLDHYLDLHPRERRNYPNPAKDPIVTRVASGKTVEVPQKIVDKALEVHRACGRVGRVERMESTEKLGSHTTMSGAHTRLAKNQRYAGGDPFILDEELRSASLQGKGLVGHDDRVAGEPTFADYPQRYDDFNRSMNNRIDRSGLNNLNDRGDPLNLLSHDRADRVLAKNRYMVGKMHNDLAHSSGPGSANGDYMDGVVGTHSDISPEDNSASVYAAIDEDMEYESNGENYSEPAMRPDINMDDYDSDPDYNCSSCGHNDGYRGNYPYYSDDHADEPQREEDYYDHVYSSHGKTRGNGKEGFADSCYNYYGAACGGRDNIGYYDEDEENDDDGENKDAMNGKSLEGFGKKNKTNCLLWLLLLVVIAILALNYYQDGKLLKRNANNGISIP